MNKNAMSDPKVVSADNKLESQAKALHRKGAYRRLKNNDDFAFFYDYLKTCYNSYIEAGGDSQIPKDMRDHLLYEAATLHKVITYIDRQAK